MSLHLTEKQQEAALHKPIPGDDPVMKIMDVHPAPTPSADALVVQLMDGISQLVAVQSGLRKAVSVSDAMVMLGIKDRKAFMHLARENNPLRLRKVGNRFIVSVQSIREYLGDSRR